MTKACEATGCKTATAPGKFMCLKHWHMVPTFKQKTITERFRAGKKNMAFLRDLEYLEACASAIDTVAAEEGWQYTGESTYSRLARLVRAKLVPS